MVLLIYKRNKIDYRLLEFLSNLESLISDLDYLVLFQLLKVRLFKFFLCLDIFEHPGYDQLHLFRVILQVLFFIVQVHLSKFLEEVILHV